MPTATRLWFRFLASLLAGAVVSFGGIYVFNLVVDPYGIRGDQGLELATRPYLELNERLHKAYAVVHARPRTLVLGSSRAETGLSVSSLGPDAYNLGLSGATMFEQAAYLEHAVMSAPVKRVFWGLDFFAFNGRLPAHQATFDPDRLATASRPVAKDALASEGVLSLDAFWAAIKTCLGQRGSEVTYAHGVRDEKLMARRVGKDPKAAFERSLRNFATTMYAGYGQADRPREFDPFAEYRRSLELCRRRGIEVHAFLSPMHAWQLELVHQLGLWPEFEAWKTKLVALHAEFAGPNGEPLPLLDFTGYHEYATEVPSPAQDSAQPMRYWWESSHYKRSLGDKVLAIVLGTAAPEGRFGRELSVDTLPSILAQDRESQLDFARRHPVSAQLVSRATPAVAGTVRAGDAIRGL